jgi:pimeloyl-ACP methyl ester carboxylesterase
VADLAHSVHGPRDGPVVLLVHGFPFDRAMWRLQVGPLTRAGYRVVAPDLAGFGQTEGSFKTMEEAALDLLQLLGRLRVDRFTAVGFSMGGYVALALAALAEQRLQGLVLVDTRAEPDSADGKAKREATIAQVQQHGVRPLAMAMLGNQLTEATRTGQRLLAEEVRGLMLRQSKAGVVGALSAMRDRPDRRDLLPALGCPVLCVVGEQDKVTPPEAAKAMADAAAGGELRIVPGAAHLTPMERPDDVTEALLGWLGKHVPATAQS